MERLADGNAINFPDPEMVGEDDPRRGSDIDVRAVCDRLNANHSLAERHLWGPNHGVPAIKRRGRILLKVISLLAVPVSWWLQDWFLGGILRWDFVHTIPGAVLMTGAAYAVLFNLYFIGLLAVYVAASLLEAKNT